MKPLVRSRLLPLAALAAFSACSAVEVGGEPPLLAGFEEPVGLLREPDDEAERLVLPAGGFTGLRVSDARRTLEALMGDSRGLVVTEVVENSPGEAADVQEGDLILIALRADGEEVALEWPSQWRKLELEAAADSELTLVIDRAGLELERTLVVAARVRPAEREEAPRLREDRRVGLVLRAATEVEARAAGLGPGGGAVVVGLAASSPWREAGIVYSDLISVAGGRAVDHPQVVLDAIRDTPRDTRLPLVVHRAGQRTEVALSVSRRERELRDVSIPLLYRYRARGDRSVTSLLLGAFRWERTEAAWSLRLLWLLSFGGGDTDRLERVE